MGVIKKVGYGVIGTLGSISTATLIGLNSLPKLQIAASLIVLGITALALWY